MEEDLATAHELQNALLPQQYPLFPSSASPAASALLSSGVGADFLHVFQLSDSVAGVFICDVMGHGVRAALVAAILLALVEDARLQATEPSRFLQKLCDDELCKQLVAEVQEFAATNEFTDDVCLIAMDIGYLMKN